MAAEGDSISPILFTYTGEEYIPDDATHIIVRNVTVVPAFAFEEHPNIVEVICHDGVEKIEEAAFRHCPNLRRVDMPGVKIVEFGAFDCCYVLTDVECGKLKIVGGEAFSDCKALRRINLPSARILDGLAFYRCDTLTEVKFGCDLERIGVEVFAHCPFLEQITIPLKDGLITRDNIFSKCGNLKRIELVKGALHETIAALHLRKWRNDVNGEIDSINRILPTYFSSRLLRCSRKARVIQTWISSVLKKFAHYQHKHRLIIDKAASTLQSALPQEIVINHVLPFLELPLHTFGVEKAEVVGNHDASSSEGSSSDTESDGSAAMEEDNSDYEEEWW